MRSSRHTGTRQSLLVLATELRRGELLGLRWGDVELDRDLVLAATGAPINPSNLRRDFLTLVERAGVPPIRIRDLRYTHVTVALGSAAPLKAVAESIGHADTRLTLSTNTHVLRTQRREIADRVGEACILQIRERPAYHPAIHAVPHL